MTNIFLPEEDKEYLQEKGIIFESKIESVPGGKDRRAVLFPNFIVPGNLRTYVGETLTPISNCNLMVLIPDGYATTKLDSFYTSPRLKRINGTDPDRANVEAALFGQRWQFWSRHLADTDWRVGIDGLGTFLSYVSNELRIA